MVNNLNQRQLNLQECIDFCGEHEITPKIKVVTAEDLGAVYEELGNKNDSVLRYDIYYTEDSNQQ